MSKIVFTDTPTDRTLGYIGGGVNKFPKELWAKIPNSELYQTHLFTLYPDFYHEADRMSVKNFRISVFASLAEHALGGVKYSLTDKFTVHSDEDLKNLEQGYSTAVLYEVDDSLEEYNLSEVSLKKTYFHLLEKSDEGFDKYKEEELLCFEDTGMGADVSKMFDMFFFIQDDIKVHPKYARLVQILDDDIDKEWKVFQGGVGYFYLDRNIKKLKHGDSAGIFFIQNS